MRRLECIRVGLMLTAVCAFPSLTDAQTRPPAPPGTVFRLTFDPKNGPPARDSGTAWLLRVGGSTVAITSYHVLAGRELETNPKFRSGDIDGLVKRVTLSSFDTKMSPITTGQNIPIERAKMMSSSDLAVLRMSVPASYPTLKLATKRPAVGDTVWLFTRLRGMSDSSPMLHPATVVWFGMETGLMFIVMHERLVPKEDDRQADSVKLVNDPTIPKVVRAQVAAVSRQFHMTFSSGGPVLDATGAVVAVNVAASVVRALRELPRQGLADCCSGWPDDQIVAFAIPADTILLLLQEALRSTAKR